MSIFLAYVAIITGVFYIGYGITLAYRHGLRTGLNAAHKAVKKRLDVWGCTYEEGNALLNAFANAVKQEL